MEGTGIIQGLPAEKFDVIRYTGACSAVADMPLMKRPRSLNGMQPLVVLKEGRGVYINGGTSLISGYNFPVAEAVVCATTTTEVCLIALTSTLLVKFLFNNTNAVAYAGTIASSGTVTWGSAATVNAGATCDLSLTRVSDTVFAVSYVDDVGDDYVCLRMGSVSGTTITLGAEKEMTAAAVSKALGTTVVHAISGVLALGYVLASDGLGYFVAIDYTTVTLGTAGTPVALAATAAKYPVVCSSDFVNGDISVAFQDDGVANDPITIRVGEVTALKVITFGTKLTAATTAAAATAISICSPRKDVIAFCWIDSSKVHLRAATISTTTPTYGTEVEVATSASGAPKVANIDGNTIIITYKETATGYGIVKRYTLTAAVLTAGRSDYFTIGSTSEPRVVGTPLNADTIALGFADAGDSAKGKILVGFWAENLIDVRSDNASERFVIWTIPVLGRLNSA